MRAKVILSAAALGLLIVGAAAYYRFAPGSPPPAPAQPATDVAASDSAPAPVVAAPTHRIQIAPRQQDSLPPAEDPRADLSAADHADYVMDRKTQLMDLATSADPAALKTILSELNNQDPEIRKTALSSVVEVGNPDAIPALRNQMAWAEDPQEKIDIQQAIDFLQLPSADQVNAEITAAKAAEQAPAPAPDGN